MMEFGRKDLIEADQTNPDSPHQNTTYGYGWMKFVLNDTNLQGHSGRMAGYTSHMYFVPDHQIGFVILVAQDFSLDMIAYYKFLDIYHFLIATINNITQVDNATDTQKRSLTFDCCLLAMLAIVVINHQKTSMR